MEEIRTQKSTEVQWSGTKICFLETSCGKSVNLVNIRLIPVISGKVLVVQQICFGDDCKVSNFEILRCMILPNVSPSILIDFILKYVVK